MDDRLSGVLQLMVFCTPLRTNMEPENEALEEEIPFGSHHVIYIIFRFHVSFRGTRLDHF